MPCMEVPSCNVRGADQGGGALGGRGGWPAASGLLHDRAVRSAGWEPGAARPHLVFAGHQTLFVQIGSGTVSIAGVGST